MWVQLVVGQVGDKERRMTHLEEGANEEMQMKES
jgi:hypothetical protein